MGGSSDAWWADHPRKPSLASLNRVAQSGHITSSARPPPVLRIAMNVTATKSWDSTAIATELNSSGRLQREPETIRLLAFLQLQMPLIETILSSAGTAPTAFTLHDRGHSYRVAQWMPQIISPESLETLSSFELTLLILAAYLHDIGMTPHEGKVNAIFAFVVTGNQGTLSDNEKGAFEEWQMTASQFDPSPASDATLGPNPGRLARAREIVAYYCRYKHNDWSADWIRANVTAENSAFYPGFVDDLVALCRSHHEGYDTLVASSFDTRRVPPGRLIHHRYLACILRIADVLDLDPERTPPVLLSVRDIAPSNLPYWHKDQGVTVALRDKVIHVSGAPTRAYLHHAIAASCDQIEDELRLCYRLASEHPFHVSLFTANSVSQPTWLLQPYLNRTIVPRAGTYEFIDGGFRPNTEKILQLLGSRELYSDPLEAVRELIQNSFDAVRERIAYDKLAAADAACDTDDLEHGRRHSVSLSLEQDGSDYQLVCNDTGAGMTKALIRDYLLVSGLSVRGDIRRLDKQCKQRGFKLERTGQFGIGVLSYFLLASQVCIETRRLLDAGDDDGGAWQFTTTGVGSFGELKECEQLLPGTTVRLTLRREKAERVVDWWQRLVEYVRATIVRAPCRMRVQSALPGCSASLRYEPGWARKAPELTEAAFSSHEGALAQDQRNLAQEVLSLSSQISREERLIAVKAMLQRAKSVLRWELGNEFRLEGVGLARIHVPIFALGAGASSVFFESMMSDEAIMIRELDIPGLPSIEPVHCLGTEGMLLLSWKGMSVRQTIGRTSDRGVIEVRPHGLHPALVELDLDSPDVGTLSLNREFIRLQNDEWWLSRLVAPHKTEALLNVALDNQESPFTSVSYAIPHKRMPLANRPF
jgi:hypothetical protein